MQPGDTPRRKTKTDVTRAPGEFAATLVHADAADPRPAAPAAGVTLPHVAARQGAAINEMTSSGQPGGKPALGQASTDAKTTHGPAPLIAADPALPGANTRQRAVIGGTVSKGQPSGELALLGGPPQAGIPAVVLSPAVAVGVKGPIADPKGTVAPAAPAKAQTVAAGTPTEGANPVQPKQSAGEAPTDKLMAGPDSAARPDGRPGLSHASAVAEAAVSGAGASHGVPQVEPAVARVEFVEAAGPHDGVGPTVRTLQVDGVQMTFTGAADQGYVRPGAADRIVQQVSASLAASRARGGQEVVVRLSPPELGRIRLQVTSEGRELRASLEVDNVRTFEEMHRQAPALVQRLIGSGLQIKGIEVSLNDSSGGQQHPDGSDGMLRDPAHTGGHADRPSGDQQDEGRGSEDDRADAPAVFVERVTDESIDVMI